MVGGSDKPEGKDHAAAAAERAADLSASSKKKSDASGTRPKEELGLTNRPPGLKGIPRAPKVPTGLEVPSEKYEEDVDVEVDQLLADADSDSDETNAGSHGKARPPSMRPSVPPALPAVAHFGRYGLLGRMAVGGMAEIYLAQEHMAADQTRHAIIKLVKPLLADDSDFDEMFVREGRIAMKLAHPNICHIYQFGRIEDRFFIAMEYVDGVTMRQLVYRAAKREVELPVPVIVAVIARVAEALHFAHRLKDSRGRPLGVVHRDVSPHNMMVSYDGVVKLLDFGVVKDRTEAPAGQSGTVKGKFAYMSPEQCSGGRVDSRADIFALGICLFEALTGRLLYKRQTQYDTFKAIIEEAVPSMLTVRPKLAAALDVIVRKALAKDPEDRFQTAGEFQVALEQYLVNQRELVNADRIAEVVQPLFEEEMVAGPELERTEEVVDRLVRFSSLTPLPLEDADLILASDTPPPIERDVAAPVVAPPPPPKKARRPWLVPAIIGGVVAFAVAAVLAFALAGDDDAPPPQVVIQPPPAAAPEPPAVEPVAEPETEPEPTETAQATDDEADEDEQDGESARDRRRRRREATMMRVRGRRGSGFVTDPGF